MHFSQALKPLVLGLQCDLLAALATITTTPPRCRKLKTDVDKPSHAWGPLLDYRFQARSISDTQNTVCLATENNIRLTVLTIGPGQLAP